MYSLEQLLDACQLAVIAGMKVVRQYQLHGVPLSEVKQADQTLVTAADRQSGLAVRQLIREKLPEIAILGEDMDGLEFSSQLLALIDPLDGTRAFANGLITSTVIAGIYDRWNKRLICCVVGEPISGRIWLASQNTHTHKMLIRADKNVMEQNVTVWNGPLDMQSTVLIDLSHGFTSRGRQILSNKQIAELFGSLNYLATILMAGSNGLHQALVANGGEKLAGSITTATGGPWDICGALLVLQAGGTAQGLAMGDDRLLTLIDPLDVLHYDILVTGNSQATVDTLVSKILAVNGQS